MQINLYKMRKLIIIILSLLSIICYSQIKGIEEIKGIEGIGINNRDTFEVLINIGQSNALGWCNQTLPSVYSGTFDSVNVFNGNIWASLNTTSLNYQYPTQYSGRWGFTIPYMVDYSRRLNKEIYVINFAIAGAGLGVDASLYDWNISSSGEWYDSLKTTIHDAFSKLNSYNKYKVSITWHQGETDSKSGVKSAAYRTNLANLQNGIKNYIINNYSSRLSTTTINWYNCIPSNIMRYSTYPYYDSIRNVMLDDARMNTNDYTIFTDNFGFLIDSVHLDSAGCMYLARIIVEYVQNQENILEYNPILWLNNNSIILSGSEVTAWNDLSGFNNNFTAVNKPDWNSLDSVVQFTLSNIDYLQDADFNSTNNQSNIELFMVGKTLTPQTNQGCLSMQNNEITIQLYTGRTYLHIGSANAYATMTDSTDYKYFSYIFDGTQSVANNRPKIRINGAGQNLTISGTFGTTTGSNTGMNLGKLFDYAIYFNGSIGEIIMINQKLTTGKRMYIENYLHRKWVDLLE